MKQLSYSFIFFIFCLASLVSYESYSKSMVLSSNADTGYIPDESEEVTNAGISLNTEQKISGTTDNNPVYLRYINSLTLTIALAYLLFILWHFRQYFRKVINKQYSE